MVTIKPNWYKAPEWAKWWAVDETGAHYWFENKPIISTSNTMWLREEDDDGKLLVAYDGDWKNSLEERPQPAQSKSQQITPASIESKLDRIIELLEKEQEADIDDLLTLAGIRPPEM